MLSTELTRRLGIEHRSCSRGWGCGRAELTVAVSNAGGLGTIGTIGRGPGKTAEEIAAVRAETDRPFAVNVLCFDWAPFASGTLDEVIEAGAPVVSLSFGDPRPGLAKCKAAGIPTMVQVQDLRGLQQSLEGGADYLVVQGNEAGGHTGLRGTLNFVAQALDMAGDTPVLAAGGIADGRGLAAALAMGCTGVLMGTRFKATPEYRGNDREKQEIVDSDGANTTYDDILDIALGIEWPNGYTGRALRSGFTEEWEGRNEELRQKVAAYPMFGFLQELAQKGQALNWAGESSGLIHEVKPAADVVRETVEEAERRLGRVGALLRAPAGA
jgi:nitronate monooxygenase